MTQWNQTTVSEFILLGFTDNPLLRIFLFVIFLCIYVVTVLGNLGMIVLIRLDPHLQTPMYFFLSNLSFSDLCYSTVIVPKTLVNFLAEKKTISFIGCGTQFYFYAVFATVECLLLAAMAYDRYVAICNPLLYPAIMSRKFCVWLVLAAYLVGCINGMIHTNTTFRLPFCNSITIHHFFCDVPLILKLACADTMLNHVLLFVISSLIGLCSFLIILISYIYILITIQRINSSEGRKKTFSTCASHLTAVTMFYATILFIYLKPTSSFSDVQDQVAAVFYTVVIPMTIINHFFCDIPAVITLSCSDTSMNIIVLFGMSFMFGTFSGSIVIISYIYILSATLKIQSTEGRLKVFSTCSSHLTAVSVFFVTLFFIYVRLSSGSSVYEDKTISMFYTIMIPMLNPLIYSLRNKEVKEALKRMCRRRIYFRHN
uniref:G-protein coupled receptors family 1 profile domain-containing protein n=1 Tax=Salvator merianae TaxID=96440 RepID=A0A8D0C930_SALMN